MATDNLHSLREHLRENLQEKRRNQNLGYATNLEMAIKSGGLSVIKDDSVDGQSKLQSPVAHL